MNKAQEMKEISKRSSYEQIRHIIEKILGKINLASRYGKFSFEYTLDDFEKKFVPEIIKELSRLGFSTNSFYVIDRIKNGYRMIDDCCTVANYIEVKIELLYISWKDA